jgi:hypothetical protein
MGYGARMEQKRNLYKIFAGKYEGRKPLWKTKRRDEDGIKEVFKKNMVYG